MKPFTVLIATAIVGGVLAIATFTFIAGGMFDTATYNTLAPASEWGKVSGPSPLLALIPLGIAVVAGVGALILHGATREAR